MNRRGFLLGAAVTLVAAPAIVRVASIMPVKAAELAVTPPVRPGLYVRGFDAYGVEITEYIPFSQRSGEKMFSKIESYLYVYEDAPLVSIPTVARAC